MASSDISNFSLNPSDYKKSIEEGTDFFIQFHTFNLGIETVITKILHRYLEHYDILFLKDTILTVLREIVNNSVKANCKRLYFTKKNFNILDQSHYRIAMESFKVDVFASDSSDFLKELELSPLVVRVLFKTGDGFLNINVINNAPILDLELAKVEARIKKAYKYADISEAFEDVLDDSEGAGLGLIMAVMLFKNAGLPDNSFRIYKKGEYTVSSLVIPHKITENESKIHIAEAIVEEINNIPSFPENIAEIQKLCNMSEAQIKIIADKISLDPGLTTSILKLVNSAAYITTKRVESIEEGVKIIGLKGINAMLIASGVQKIVGSRYKRFDSVWKNSLKRAFYAQKIAIHSKQHKLGEFAYLSALLADIGLIVLLSVSTDLMKKLKEIAGSKGLQDVTILEEISLGVSHSTLGSMICQKWKFNEALTASIEYHHKPYTAPSNIKDLVFIVYLADSFIEIENRKRSFETIDEEVLSIFSLQNKKDFEALHKGLAESYEKNSDESSPFN